MQLRTYHERNIKMPKTPTATQATLFFTLHEDSLSRCRRATVHCNNNDVRRNFITLKSHKQRDYRVIGY